jgi:anti-sigma B factor antagonist
VDDRPQFRTELTRPRDGLAVATIIGEIDLYTAPRLHEVLLQGIAEGAHQVVVDLSAVTFIDSTALGVLVRSAKQLGPDGGALHLVCGPGGVRRLIEIAGLTGVFAMHSTLDEALAALAG